MNDFEAKKILVAWTLYAPTFKETAALKNEDIKVTLLRWWLELKPKIEIVAAIAGIPFTRAQKIFSRLQAAYLVWPDGTIASDAQTIIIGERNAYVGSLMAKQPPAREKGNTYDGQSQSKDAEKSDRKSARSKANVQAGR